MAAGAGFDLAGGVLAFKVDFEAAVGQRVVFGYAAQMAGRRTVAGLATDTEAVPLAVEAVTCSIKITFVAGGVTFNAHKVGVLARFAPVQRVLEVHPLARIQMKPALFFSVPGHAQGLQPAVTDLEQILLQWRNAEGVGDLEVCELAIRPRCVDPELVTLAKEPAVLAFALECGIVEVGQYGLRFGGLHGQLMMRALPVFDLGIVTTLALLLVDHLRRSDGPGRHCRGQRPGLQHRRRNRHRAVEIKPQPAQHQQQHPGAYG